MGYKEVIPGYGVIESVNGMGKTLTCGHVHQCCLGLPLAHFN
jgi:hypothetical protein